MSETETGDVESGLQRHHCYRKSKANVRNNKLYNSSTKFPNHSN